MCNCDSFTPIGWKCPLCGRVYSPTQPMCMYCGGNAETVKTGTSAEIKVDGVPISEWAERETHTEG